MSDSESSNDDGFDAQDLAETREKTSLVNPDFLIQYLGAILIGIVSFPMLGEMLGIGMTPSQYPPFGMMTLGAIVGFGAIHERHLSPLKIALSTFGYFVFSNLGFLFIFYTVFARLSVVTVAIIFGMIGGAFIWYYLRHEVLTDKFE